MKRTILLYGGLMALLTILLKSAEYHYLARRLAVEWYGGLVAVLFTALGIWVGLRLTRPPQLKKAPLQESGAGNIPAPPAEIMARLSISPREFEILQLMAQGLTNQEIAGRLFISHNTVKTHLSNLFSKLDVQRRTQAVQRARELRLL